MLLDDPDLAVLLDAMERYELGIDDDDGVPAAAGEGRGAGLERPSQIAHAPAEIHRLLELAEEEGWLVRLSYTSGAGKALEVTVDVLDVSERVMLGQVAPRWSEQKYVLERIGWARVLTDAEEELL